MNTKTDKEKAKAYDEAIERAKEQLNGAKVFDYDNEQIAHDIRTTVYGIFPELKESEDEKVEKAIFAMVYDSDNELWSSYGVSKSDVLSWLEKQGELFPIDKYETKFNIGDYVVDNCGYIWRIEGVINQFYVLEGIEGGESRPTIEWVDNTFHHWTIYDAKDGDILVNGSNIFIFHFINDTRLMGYCHVNIDDGRFYDDIGKNECFCLIDAVVNPATKEQRDLLFQKMKEAGFTFDFDKKELGKIEQKKDVYNKLTDFETSLKHMMEEAIECGDIHNLKADADMLLRLAQKTAWSEEDEYNFAFIQEALLGLDGDDSYREKCCKMADWLESLKDKFVDFDKGFNVGFSAAKHNQWKPSEEQMERLKGIINSLPHQEVLYSLYQDLLKLKG